MSLTRPRLSGREQDILALLGQRFGVAQITRRLYISESTAKRHIEEVYQKLGAGLPAATLGTRLRAHAEHAARTFGLSSHLEIDPRAARSATRFESKVPADRSRPVGSTYTPV
jgi:Bacterial regulatory proteins, luxR family